MSGRVIVVGSVNVDLVVSVARLPGPGETVIGGRFERHHGGKGGNQAVAAARLGVPAFFVGAVGDDAFGEEARAALESEGIDCSALRRLDRHATGVALITVDEAGENTIAVAGGANAMITSLHVRDSLKRLALTVGDVVLVGHEIRTGATHEALRLGRLAGATTILNPAPAAGLEAPTLALADLLTPNEGELAVLAAGVEAARSRRGEGAGAYGGGRTASAGGGGRTARAASDGRVPGTGPGDSAVSGSSAQDGAATDPAASPAASPAATTAAAKRLLGPDAGDRAVLVSLGGRGAMLVAGRRSTVMPARRVDVIDTVGAGDALNGALAAGLAAGLSLEDAARRAVIAASLAVTRAGAREGMPTAE